MDTITVNNLYAAAPYRDANNAGLSLVRALVETKSIKLEELDRRDALKYDSDSKLRLTQESTTLNL